MGHQYADQRGEEVANRAAQPAYAHSFSPGGLPVLTNTPRAGESAEQTAARSAPRGKPAALQTQIGGSHYTDMKIQPIEYILANNIPFPEGNVIKYVSRWRAKGGVKDLRKSIHHLEMLIEHEESIGTA